MALVLVGLLSVTLVGGYLGFQRWHQDHLRGNEALAIAQLRGLAAAQAQFRASCALDEDGDGKGEYGHFLDLSAQVKPPVLASKWAGGTATELTMDGYRFGIYLPADPDLRETSWVVYAWPEKYGWSGRRVFGIDQSGDIIVGQNAEGRYSGEQGWPTVHAMYLDF